MAALTLEAWRDRTLEQVHFAAQAALHTVAVQGHPSLRQCVAATATGSLLRRERSPHKTGRDRAPTACRAMT